MRLAYDVPSSVRKAAERALAVHRSNPLEDVSGIAVAEVLATGVATIDQIARMHRFFSVNGRVYEAELQGLRTELDSALCRSWLLHGAESGRSWAERLYGCAVREGFVPAETTTDLLGLQPDEIYSAFSLGAWRFEYALDPRKAARFVEEYHRATGWNLDLRRAFGDSAGAVGNALHRRFHPVDPFRDAARCLTVEDAEYRLAANVDLQEITDSFDALEEGLKPTVYVASANVTAKLVWPGFIAYVILAAERPDLLVQVNKASQKPPLQGQKPKAFTAYHDPIWTYVSFFHPLGNRWVDPKKADDASAKLFGSLPEELEELMVRAYHGRHVAPAWAQKLLGRARRWTAQNKFAGSLFHVFNADWKKGNWQHILDNIPEDHDVRPAFAEFVKESPKPAEGVKLQQTLSDKGLRKQVFDYLKVLHGFKLLTAPEDLTPVKIDDTASGLKLKGMGTPIGVYSLIEFEHQQYYVLGAYLDDNENVVIVFSRNGILNHAEDNAFQSNIVNGDVTVLLAHKDMPGTTYKGTPELKKGVTAADEPEPETESKPDVLPDWLIQAYPIAALIDLKSTAFYKETLTKYAIKARTEQKWIYVSPIATRKLELVGAFRNGSSFYVAWSDPSGGTPFVLSQWSATVNVKNGSLIPASKFAVVPEPTAAKSPVVIASWAEDLAAKVDGKPVALSTTQFAAESLKKYGVKVRVEQKWIYVYQPGATTGASHLEVGGAMKRGGILSVIFTSDKVPDPYWLFDHQAAGDVAIGKLVPASVFGTTASQAAGDYLDQIKTKSSPSELQKQVDAKLAAILAKDPFAFVPKETPVQQAPTSTTPTAEPLPNPFAFLHNEIVAWSDSNWLILGDLQEKVPYYVALELYVAGPDALTIPTKILKSALETEGKVLKSGQPSPLTIAAHLKYAGSVAPTDFTTDKLPLGIAILYEGSACWPVAFREVDGQPHVVLLRDETTEFSGHSFNGYSVLVSPVAEIVPNVVQSSYIPPVLAPESSHEEDEPDPEQGSFEMSGTAVAFNFLKERGWTPATKSESPLFVFPLGGKQFYGKAKKRTVLGYGFHSDSTPVYVHVTEVGNLGWVTCLGAHKKYGPLDTMVQAVVNALLPKPGEAAKQKFPKLNYKLSKQAKAVAQNTGLIFVSAPKGSNFKVGTPLFGDFTNLSLVLLGWLDEAGDTRAVLADEESTTAYHSVTLATLNKNYSLQYKNKGTVWSDKGEVTFGKIGSSFQVATNSLYDLHLPSAPEAGWDDPAPVVQPPFDSIPSGKHVAAGVIVLVPAGTSMVFGGGGPTLVTPSGSVALYYRLGDYAGYTLSIPKGTVDKGESLIKAAVREVFEETGLTTRPVAFLGDFPGNDSVTRMYIGCVTGGDPTAKAVPEESDAVTFKPLTPDYQSSSWYKELIPASGNPWQQKAVDAAYAWVQEHGYPGNFQPSTETQHAAVTALSDVHISDPFPTAIPADIIAQGVKKIAGAVDAEILYSYTTMGPPQGWAPNIPPSDVDKHDVWKTLLFKSPFPITSQMVELFKKKQVDFVATPVSFDVARDRPVGPKYGQSFETKAGTPYIAHGYVSWIDAFNLSHHFLIALTSAGSVEILDALKEGLPDAKVSSDQTVTNAPQDAWFQHPDPAINTVIQGVFKTGTLEGTGTNMATFKVKWMKDAGVAAYAVITQNLLRDVCSLFVPGAASQGQLDAIIGCLKARMKATHSGKKVAKHATVIDLETDATGTAPAVPFAPPPPYIPKTVLSTGPLSPILKQYVNTPQPHLFTKTGEGVKGGSKPNMLLHGPGGKQWLAKYATGEDWRSHIDRAAYQLSELVKGNNIPVGVMSFDGKIVSYQPYASNATPPPADPTELDEQNMSELLSQHAADMFMGDHDGHVGNWISVDGRIIAVDRGQAFKFVLKGGAESLDPHWHAPGNFGDGYAKKLLIRWSEGKVEIPIAAWTAMLKTIRAVGKITDAQILAVLSPVLSGLGMTAANSEAALDTLRDRRDAYEKDWTFVLRKLRKGFKWPESSVGTIAPAKVFTASPKELAFGKREEKTIAEAAAAKWQGKSIRIGGLALENQEVMVRQVRWEQKGGVKTPATLIHFRVTRPAGVEAAKRLYAFAGLDFTDSLGGPQRLKVDHQSNFWEKVYAAIKTTNHHLHIKKDTEINMNTIAQMSAMRPDLEQLTKVAVNPDGVYGPTGEANEAVYAMAEQYLQYLGIVEYWVAKKAELVGQHSPTLVEFLWEPPPPTKIEDAKAPPYRVLLKKQGALWPTAVPVGQSVEVVNLNKPVHNSASQSQFVIEDPTTGARLFWNPPGGTHTSGLENVKDGVESLKGQGWGIIPGEPSAQTVAHLLKLFQEPTGLPMRAATKEDDTVLYWSRQAQVLQGGGVVHPKPDHTTVVEPGYATALAEYAKGNAEQAIARLKAFVGGKLGKTAAELEQMVSASDVDGQYTRGAGFLRHTRIGWTRAKLQKLMGTKCRVAHSISDTVDSLMEQMRNNGALLANAVKVYYGVTKVGASYGTDMDRGGGQGLFACFRSDQVSKENTLYFDISLALRLDVYIVGTDDTYGSTALVRYATPEQWVNLGAHKGHGKPNSSSHLQVNIRHDIDLQEYLVTAVCGSATERSKCIKIANELGWKFYGGAAPEEVFVA